MSSHAGRLDDIAHVLYCPTMLGQHWARDRWHHHIHLIPGFVLEWFCDRYDRALFGADEN